MNYLAYISIHTFEYSCHICHARVTLLPQTPFEYDIAYWQQHYEICPECVKLIR